MHHHNASTSESFYQFGATAHTTQNWAGGMRIPSGLNAGSKAVSVAVGAHRRIDPVRRQRGSGGLPIRGSGAGSDPQRWSPTASTPQRPRHLIGRGVAGDWSGSGFPLPDPIVGLIICIAIFILLWRTGWSVGCWAPEPHGCVGSSFRVCLVAKL